MQCLVSMLQHLSFAPRHWLLRIASIWASLGDIDRSVAVTVALGGIIGHRMATTWLCCETIGDKNVVSSRAK